jgi:flavin-dependent dehydrogenase
MFSRQTGYQPPRALSSIVTKYHPGSEAMHAFGNYIHAFLPQHALIEFGAVTPKKNHLTINIAGGAVSSALMEEFLARPDVSSVLRNIEAAGKFDPHDFRFFKGRFPCSTALNYYGDRYVMIGDAAGLVRAFKGKGVNSAVITGIRAADTIIRYGTSKEAFATHYHKANQDILHDLPYGRIARILTIGLARTRLISMVIKAARYDPDLRSSLFDAVSAGDTYQSVLARALSPKTVWRVLRELANPYPTQLETSDR